MGTEEIRDEARALMEMSDHSFGVAAIILELGFTRKVIRLAPEELADVRAHQGVLRKILCATEFGDFARGARYLLAFKNVKRLIVSTISYNVPLLPPPPPSLHPEPMVLFLTDLARRAHRINAGLPIPAFLCRVKVSWNWTP